MYPPLTSYVGDSKTVLFRLLNERYRSHLSTTEVDVSFPIAIDRTETRLYLTPYHPASSHGTVSLTYQRWDLAQFFYGITLTTLLNDTLTKERLCQEIETQHRVSIDPTDVDVTLPPTDTHTVPYPIHVKAKPESVLWVGELTVWAVLASPLDPELQKLLIAPNGYRQKQHAYLYAMQYDFSGLDNTVVDALVTEGTLHTLNATTHHLLAFLKERSGDDWTLTRELLSRNLFGAKVAQSHGILTITLGPQCRDLHGTLVFDPPRPETVYPTVDLDGFDYDTPLDQLVIP